MTAEKKRAAVERYCLSCGCSKCVLKDKGWKTQLNQHSDCLFIQYATEEEIERAYALINQPAAVQENGGNDMETPTITISLRRYDELIKKEVLYDGLTKNKGINMYLFQEVSEPLREGANNE